MNKLRSAALLSPIAYVGQMTSPLAKNAADNFLAEVNTNFFSPYIYINSTEIPDNLYIFFSQALYWLGLDEFDPRGYIINSPYFSCIKHDFL